MNKGLSDPDFGVESLSNFVGVAIPRFVLESSYHMFPLGVHIPFSYNLVGEDK